jgi:hypothetical protein
MKTCTGCYCGSSGCQEGAKTPCPAECPAGKYFSKSWYLGLSFWARIFKAWPYGCENVDIGILVGIMILYRLDLKKIFLVE